MVNRIRLTAVLLNTTVFCLFVCVPVQAHAAIYKCIKEGDKVYYNDKPCPVEDIEEEVQPVKDPKNPYVLSYKTVDEEKDKVAAKVKGVVIGDQSETKELSEKKQTESSNESSQVGDRSSYSYSSDETTYTDTSDQGATSINSNQRLDNGKLLYE